MPVPKKGARLGATAETATVVTAKGGGGCARGKARWSVRAIVSRALTEMGLRRRRLEDSYVVREEVGRGTWSRVLRCEERSTGLSFAVKVYDLTTPCSRISISREASILRSLASEPPSRRCPHVLEFRDSFATRKAAFLVTELLSGGDLSSRLRECRGGVLDEDEARSLAQQLVTAVAHLHDRGILHRDVKLENVLFSGPTKIEGERAERREDLTVVDCSSPHVAVSRGALKLIDFGFARSVLPPQRDTGSGDPSSMRGRRSLERKMTPCGSLMYAAPEILRKDDSYGRGIDMWSCGVVVYITLCGYPPFWDDDTLRMQNLIATSQFSWPPESVNAISADAKDFVSSCLQVDPASRITARSALTHRWFQPRV